MAARSPLPGLTLSYWSSAVTRRSQPAGCTLARSAPSRADTAAAQVRAPHPSTMANVPSSGGQGTGATLTPRPLHASGSRMSVRDGPRGTEIWLLSGAPARSGAPLRVESPRTGPSPGPGLTRSIVPGQTRPLSAPPAQHCCHRPRSAAGTWSAGTWSPCLRRCVRGLGCVTRQSPHDQRELLHAGGPGKQGRDRWPQCQPLGTSQAGADQDAVSLH